MASPNVLFIFSDEHSPHALGCYGNSAVKTPHLDTLAAGGTRFANAYCNVPLCVPSRASLATGRYAHTLSAWDNASPYTGAEAPSWGHRLTAHGHQVTTIGKLHYRRVEDPTGFPDQRLPMHVVEGIGDIYGCLRGEMPVRQQNRRQVLGAGPGDHPYARYDRAVAEAAVRWLRDEAPRHARPWVLFVSFANPHFPLVAPAGYFRLYDHGALPMPVAWRPDEWAHHPVLDLRRRQQALEEPVNPRDVQRALAAYYGKVTFLDEQVGRVLCALRESGADENTLKIYASDHGNMLGEHGLWWKSCMYEGSVGIPMILAGPGALQGKVVHTPVSLVDCVPTLIEALDVDASPEDADLPGSSLLGIIRDGDPRRTVFSEYHAIFSPSGIFMLRDDRYKYVHYVGYPSQLFDMRSDPHELVDLAGDPSHADVVAAFDGSLRALINPEEVDRKARADQQRRIDAAGGAEAVKATGVKVVYTPAPGQFDDEPPGADDVKTAYE